MLIDYFKFALRNIRRRKLRSWLTMIGIFIGIAAVVSLISLGQGLENAILGQIAFVGGDKLTIKNAETGFGPPGSFAIKKLNEHDIKVIKSVKGIDEVIPRIIRSAPIEFKDKIRYDFVVSIPHNQKQINIIMESLRLDMFDGRMLSPNDKYSAVVGYNFAWKELFDRKLKVGDKIKVNNKEFKIVGIMGKTGNPQFDSAIYLPEKGLGEALNINDEYDLIIVKVSNEKNVEKVSKDIKKAMRKDRNLDKGKEDFSVETPQKAISAFNTILTAIQAVIIGIATISLLVGGIGILNTMYTSVLERTREIGIMKSIGAKNSDILILFLIDSGILGLGGGIIGIALGIMLSKGVEFFGENVLKSSLLQAQFSLSLIIGALIFSFVLGSLSGILPAYQASKLNPVDALKGNIK